jgi:hypothetical protein
VPVKETVRARLRTRRGDAPADARVVARGPDGSVHEIAMGADAEHPGEATGLFEPAAPGLWTFDVTAAGLRVASPATTLFAEPAPAETDDRSADTAALRALAERAGGKTVGMADLAATVRSFESSETARRSGYRVWQPSWSTAAWLLPVAACLGLEWFLRRRLGLT